MSSRCLDLSQLLHTTLTEDIAALMPELPTGASAVLALRRLHALAEHSPTVLTWLAQPWWDGDIEATLVHCARIHLYARILDDALDENLPIHRLLLLRAQSLLWASAGELAKGSPHHWQHSTQLIYETINAVENDDQQPASALWGLKNHHLLLVPLLLSDNHETWHKAALSDLIWLMQTGDEWRQGGLTTKVIKHDVLGEVERIMTAQTPTVLAEGGWQMAAERALWECQQLLLVLPN